MKTLKANSRTIAALVATTLILLALVSAPAQVRAGDDDRGRGLFIGINVGVGGSSVEYKESTRTITEDPVEGGYGALRVGYAFSRTLSLSVEGHGFGADSNSDSGSEKDWGVGASVLAVTWHPGGKGFYVRGGAGIGGGDYIHPDTDELVSIRNRAAALFGLGYDWPLGKNTTLGVACDALSINAGRSTGHDEDQVGAGSLSVQFNWHL
jgi:hypothetical protein